MKIRKVFTIASIGALMGLNSFGQSTSTIGQNTITTAVPFLRIGPDSRSGAMGDVGVALSPDANGAYWNVGKMAMINDNYGGGMTLTPWLRGLGVEDVFVLDLNGYYKIDTNQTVGLNLKYFSLGTLIFTDVTGTSTGIGNPREMCISGFYSRKFSSKFSGGVALRYINSALNTGNNTGNFNSGNAIASDIGFYYKNSKKDKLGLGNELALGLSITNLGSKISYSATGRPEFIPTNMALGAAYTKQLDEFNKITFALDVNKLLVPTPQIDANGNTYIDTNITIAEGIFKGFCDAPGGLNEEIQEFNVGLGMEYWYQDQFAVRGGYFYESVNKGARQFISLGVGLKYNVFGFNFSYIVPSNSKVLSVMPLSNTMRFSLLFDINKANLKTSGGQQASAF